MPTSKSASPFNAATDPLCVKTSDLVRYVNEWLARNEPVAIHTETGARAYQDKSQYHELSAIAKLAQYAGVQERTIRRVLSGESLVTSLALADRLVCGMAATWLLSPLNGPIKVQKNPRWKVETFVEYMKRAGVDASFYLPMVEDELGVGVS
jgi:hypothetical protein